jgi:NADP-dependent 3-hydroxy acid dehydrogenase YdfG
MNLGLAQSVVIVTGAASGIGAAIARAAHAEGTGALVLTDRDAPALARIAAELNAHPVTADLADPTAPAHIATEATSRFGRIDGLVNAAGLTTRGSFVTGTAEVWDQLFAVNGRAA